MARRAETKHASELTIVIELWRVLLSLSRSLSQYLLNTNTQTASEMHTLRKVSLTHIEACCTVAGLFYWVHFRESTARDPNKVGDWSDNGSGWRVRLDEVLQDRRRQRCLGPMIDVHYLKSEQSMPKKRYLVEEFGKYYFESARRNMTHDQNVTMRWMKWEKRRA